MNKMVIGLLVVAAIGLVAWMMFSSDDMIMEEQAQQEFTIDEEVAELEAELVAVEAAVAAGTLTPQDAAAAQARISTRLEAIASVSAQAQSATTLTAAQRAQLSAGLDRLQNILVTFQATLEVVDEQVMTLPEAERPQLFRGRTSVRGAIEAAVVEVDAVTSPESGVEVETEAEMEAGTTAPDTTEIDVVDEEEDEEEEEDAGMEAGLEGEVELEAAPSN